MSNSKKILLVEDDFFISDIYQTKFRKEGFEVAAAENGLKAIECLKKDLPDLILLDIVMPFMDGMETLKEIKAEEKWKNIPVIILSNISEKEKMQEALALGAKDYLIKSNFTPSEIMEKIKIHFA